MRTIHIFNTKTQYPNAFITYSFYDRFTKDRMDIYDIMFKVDKSMLLFVVTNINTLGTFSPVLLAASNCTHILELQFK